MKLPKRPKGRKYRNLYRELNGIIYYDRQRLGERHHVSCKTRSWDEAAAVRDEYEAEFGVGRVAQVRAELPTFEAFVKRYLKEDTAHLAPTTLVERERELAEEGPVVSHFGHLRLDEITKAHLREWWTAEVQNAKRSTKTDRNYLDAVSGVFSYAEELGLVGDDRARRRCGAFPTSG